MIFENMLSQIKTPEDSISKAAQEKIDFLTKPQGSLGRLEEIALKISVIQNNLNPRIERKELIVFAADHGIAQEGVSAFPQEVTAQMVVNFASGGAAINVFCRQNNIALHVADMGVKGLAPTAENLSTLPIGPGTRNFAKEPAMTRSEAQQALQAGADLVCQLKQKNDFQILAVGDMGIANTTSASAIVSAVTGLPAEITTGRGTGIDDPNYAHKIKVIDEALALHKPISSDGIDILTKVGGFEIGGIAGAILAAASLQIPIVLDGHISTAGALIAYLISPKVQPYLFAGHVSVEQGHIAALKFLQLEPILNLNLRLGEGTGAALAIHIIEAACRMMSEMASFKSAGVANRE